MKKILLTAVCTLLCTMGVWASKTYVENSDGVKIWYDFDDATKTASVIQCVSSYEKYSGSINIPETVVYSGTTYSVTSIGDGAFSGCSGLTNVTIPNSVTSIGDLAFSDCSGLKSIEVDAINPSYSSKNGILYNKDKTKLIQCPGNKTGSVTIPNSVTSIGDGAFGGCTGLTNVTIPNSVTSIGDVAFYDCSGLTNVTIPNSVKSIGNYAFSGCSRLTSVTILNSVTSIGDGAFGGCSGLMKILNVKRQ